MTPPAMPSRVLLVEDRRGTPPGPVVSLRRYRLARVRLDARRGGSAGRFQYLKRSHD